ARRRALCGSTSAFAPSCCSRTPRGPLRRRRQGPPRTSPPSSSFDPFPLGVLLLLGLVLVGGVKLRQQSPSSLASLSSVVERSSRRGKLPAGSPQSPHQHSRPRTRRGGGGGACGHGAVAAASNMV